MSNKLKCFCPFNLSLHEWYTPPFSGSNLVFIFSPEVLEIHTHLLTLTNPKTHVCLLSVQTNLFSIVPWGRKEVIREVTRNKLRISDCRFDFFLSCIFFSHELSRFYERSKGLVRFSYKKIQEVIEEGEDALGEEMYFSKEGGEKGVP